MTGRDARIGSGKVFASKICNFFSNSIANAGAAARPVLQLAWPGADPQALLGQLDGVSLTK